MRDWIHASPARSSAIVVQPPRPVAAPATRARRTCRRTAARASASAERRRPPWRSAIQRAAAGAWTSAAASAMCSGARAGSARSWSHSQPGTSRARRASPSTDSIATFCRPAAHDSRFAGYTFGRKGIAVQPLFEHRRRFGGFETRVLELEGDGPPLVLLHGYADSADTWRHVLDRLGRRDRRAVAVDLPGFATADRLRKGRVLPQLDRSVAAVVSDTA